MVIPVPVLSGLAFIKKYWKYFALGLAVGFVGFLIWKVSDLKHDKADLKADKAALEKTVSDYKTALKTSQDAADAKIAALEAESLDAKARADKLSKDLTDIEASNEKISCPIPAFIRRVISD